LFLRLVTGLGNDDAAGGAFPQGCSMTSITAGQDYRSHQTQPKRRIANHYWVAALLLVIVLCAVAASNYTTGSPVEMPFVGP
jgi:hypothetical protein